MDDAEALRRIRTDPDAVCVLYDRHVGPLVAGLARRTGDRELAFEIAQETFARALERGHRVRLEQGTSAWPWLWSVARNLLADHHRRGAVDARARTRLGMATVTSGSVSATASSRARRARASRCSAPEWRAGCARYACDFQEDDREPSDRRV